MSRKIEVFEIQFILIYVLMFIIGSTSKVQNDLWEVGDGVLSILQEFLDFDIAQQLPQVVWN